MWTDLWQNLVPPLAGYHQAPPGSPSFLQCAVPLPSLLPSSHHPIHLCREPALQVSESVAAPEDSPVSVPVYLMLSLPLPRIAWVSIG